MTFYRNALFVSAIPLTERIHVVHATAPGCSWSWGYEAVVNRLRMVYGDQIDIDLRLGCPYEDRDQWLKDYEMSAEEAEAWTNDECFPMMGVPMRKFTWADAPPTVLPATLATVAALRQGEEKGWRFNRALMRMQHVEGRDIMDIATPLAAAAEARLDVEKFKHDTEDEKLLEEYGERAQSGPPVHVGFYNVVVWDGSNRRVQLDYTFDPAEVEAAIDYLARGSLKKKTPTDVHAYLRAHGDTPLVEVARAFAMKPQAAQAELERLEKAGKAERRVLAGAPHWRAT